MRVFYAMIGTFVMWLVYNTGYYNGRTDAYVEMRNLLKNDGSLCVEQTN